ncbi:Gustatory receptor for sugar taste 64f [Frankliniella fusca]|uniref:Gustatory receptor for sugar taste 64f n=1 Tax=Frankliniella fusca TaxID=407009 RepID=A0AAE1H714_9NEOP|nr:Gustatory receptor for sugar taste 64f [Frankliniella fusca]
MGCAVCVRESAPLNQYVAATRPFRAPRRYRRLGCVPTSITVHGHDLRAVLARMAADARRRLRCREGAASSCSGAATPSSSSRSRACSCGAGTCSCGSREPQLKPPHLNTPAAGVEVTAIPLGRTYTLPPLQQLPLHDADAVEQVERPPSRPPPPPPASSCRDSLSEALRPALAVAQVFLVLPVGARCWARRVRTAALLVVMLAVIALAAAHVFRSGISLPSCGESISPHSPTVSSSHLLVSDETLDTPCRLRTAPFMFYGTAALFVHLLSRLAVHWPRLSSCWNSSGSLLTEGLDLEDDRRTVRTCKIITVVMLLVALRRSCPVSFLSGVLLHVAVEHILSVLNGLMPLLACREHGGAWVVYKSLFINLYPTIFDVVPFSVPVSILVVYLNLTCTFLWNFIDVLIIVISFSLATRFRTLGNFLRQAKGKASVRRRQVHGQREGKADLNPGSSAPGSSLSRHGYDAMVQDYIPLGVTLRRAVVADEPVPVASSVRLLSLLGQTSRVATLDYSIFWWQEVREAYNRLSLLTRRFDDHINAIVLLSFASNLYFICLQLLFNMTHYGEDDLFSGLYFYFSFAWLLARAALVSMSAASVYEQAAAPTEVLYSVPSKSFNAEVQRFLVQTTTDTVALSGARFFYVTRSLVLTLAGTIATYEIVLVQFHSDVDQNRRVPTVCYP